MYNMPSAKNKKSKSNKLLKINASSGSDSDDGEHELSFYLKDKVRLMKEVLKLIKPKKIKSMAPDCIKNLDIVEINSMLLEELLGISNKRLQYIFNGENVDRETSSSESEEEKQPIDVISLDDISDDDDIELCISQDEKDSLETGLSKKNKKHKSSKIKTEPSDVIIKSEKVERSKKDNKKKSRKVTEPKKQPENAKGVEENLMSVLELLELQARARAIRSQLAIETEKKAAESTQNVKQEEASDSDAIIIDSPQRKEIVITSSESEGEGTSNKTHSKHRRNNSVSILANETPSTSSCPRKKQKIHSKQDDQCSNSNQQENVEESTTINLVNTDDETENTKEMSGEKGNVESDNKKRKEKLLAKLQKIKLVRSKVPTNTAVGTEMNAPSNTTNEGSDITTTSAFETCTENSEVSTINNLPNNAKEFVDVETENGSLEDNKVTEVQNIKLNEDLGTVESIITKEGSPQDTPKPINTTYCDNDEIVINLDEDEMDGIENV